MKSYLKSRLPRSGQIVKLRAEASSRQFFRVPFSNRSLVAMMYPDRAPDEIEAFVRMTDLYREFGLHVAEIVEVLDERGILLEDLGDISLQRFFGGARRGEKERVLRRVARLLTVLKRVPPGRVDRALDTGRLEFEMDFFRTHFMGNFIRSHGDDSRVKAELRRLAAAIPGPPVFGHRDFHSRNMQVCHGEVYLVDYQDSMRVPDLYDLASFAFDSYLDLKDLREPLFEMLRDLGSPVDRVALHLTALQRNLKALGTFGFQIVERKNRTYQRYVERTVRHILGNPCAGDMIPHTLAALSTLRK